MLKKIADHIWSIESHLKLSMGLKMSVRSTVVQLQAGVAAGSLMVISPVQTLPEDLEELRQLGTVRFIVAPNCMHHLFLANFAKDLPEAEVWGPHCLQDKRRDIPFKGTLSSKESMPWEADVEMISVKAKAPMMEEFIFFHHASKTAIVTDLLFNYQEFDHWSEAMVAKLNGGYKKLAMTKLARRVFNDKQSLHWAASHMLSWNPDNLIVAHGNIIQGGAAHALQDPLSEFAPINS